MGTETSSTPVGTSVSGRGSVDQIAQMLTAEPAKPEINKKPSILLPPTAEAKKPEEVVEGEQALEGEEAGAGKVLEPEEEVEVEQDVSWASVLNVDESKLVLDDDGNFKAVKIKVDGKESDVDLNTLIAGYQTSKSTTQKAQALAEERRKFEASSSKALELFQAKLQEAEEFTKYLHKKFMADYEGINLQELRQRNPAEYAATVADIQTRQNDLNNMMRSIYANKQAAEQHQQQQQQEARQSFLQQQANRTLEMFPEWRDKSKAQADFAAMGDFVEKYGFTQDEFKEIVDPRILKVLKDMMGTKLAEVEAINKAAKPVPPKMLTSTRSRNAKPASKLDRLIKRAHGATGASKRIAQADAIAELLISR